MWPYDWVKNMEKLNEVVDMNNRLMMGGVGKRIVFITLIMKYLCKCIGRVLLAVTYGNKGHKLWS